LIQQILAQKGIIVSPEEAEEILGFLKNLENLKADFDARSDSTKDILLTQVAERGFEHVR